MVIQENVASASKEFSALSDGTRARIVQLLATQDRCVCHLIDDLDLGQSIISHHIGVLRRSGLVDSYPHPSDRRWMYYRLNRKRIEEIGRGLLELAGTTDYNPERLPCPIDIDDTADD